MNQEALALLRLPSLYTRRVRIWGILVLATAAGLAIQTAYPGLALVPGWGADTSVAMVLTVFAAALACEYLDSSLGMGYGTTLTPLLLLAGFEPLDVVPAILLSELVTGLTAGLMHHRDGNIDLLRNRQVRFGLGWLSLLSLVGALTAVFVAVSISRFWLTLAIGVIIVTMGILILATLRRPLPYRAPTLVAVGAVAAFNKGLSGGGYGPLVTAGQVVSGIPAKHAVAITSLAESFTCLVGLVAYLILRGGIEWSLAVPLTLGALLSVPMATITVRHLPEGTMRAAVGILTCTLGVIALLKLLAN